MNLSKHIFDNCSLCDCSQKRLIVHKKKYLCALKMEKPKGLSRGKSKLKKFSSKRNSVENSYREAKIKKVQEEGAQCTGCLAYNRLSLSHLIPRSRRPDLIDNPKNHRIHCMDGDGVIGCHTKWENKDWDSLLDIQECLILVKELDVEYYRLITSKC